MTALIESLELRTHFDSSGGPDPSFGVAGTATLRGIAVDVSATPSTTPLLLRVDGVGRTVVLSATKTTGVDPVVNLTRLTADGVADPRFAPSVGGTLTVSTFNDPNRIRLAIDVSDRIYVLVDRVLTRYSTLGRIDRTFGSRGHLDFNVFSETGQVDVNDFALTQSGTIYLTGQQFAGDTFNDSSMVVFRAMPDGQVDRTFGTEGIYKAPPPPNQSSQGDSIDETNVEGDFIRVLTDGSIVVAGKSELDAFLPTDGDIAVFDFDTEARQTGVQVLKLRPNGRVDKTYGRNGVANYVLPTEDGVSAAAAPVGIRHDGAVVIYNDTETAAPNNITFSATGQLTGPVDLGNTLKNAQFFGEFENREYIVDLDAKTLIQVDDDNAINTGFHNGEPINGVFTATRGNDSSLITADTGRSAVDSRFNVRRIWGTQGPAGQLLAGPLTAPSRTLTFRVVWRDNDAVVADSVTGSEIRVIGPDGSVRRGLLVAKRVRNGVVIADYAVRFGSGRTTFTAANNGVYTVHLLALHVLDTSGIAAALDLLGSLVVNIA